MINIKEVIKILSCKAGDKLINTVDYNLDDIKKWSRKRILKCPICESEVGFRNGKIRIPHFYHIDKNECDYGYWENETKTHYLGKIILYNWIKNLKEIERVNLEYWIKETKQRPDIYFEYKNTPYIIEFQCSNLTVEAYLDRRKLYSLMNIKDIWIFGTDFNINKLKVVDKFFMQDHGRAYYLKPFKNQLQGIIKDSRKTYRQELNTVEFKDGSLVFDYESTPEPKPIVRVEGFKEVDQGEDYYKQKVKEGLMENGSRVKVHKYDLNDIAKNRRKYGLYL